MLTRRSILAGLIAAPAIVKAASLMPVRGIIMPVDDYVDVEIGRWMTFKSMAENTGPLTLSINDEHGKPLFYTLPDDIKLANGDTLTVTLKNGVLVLV